MADVSSIERVGGFGSLLLLLREHGIGLDRFHLGLKEATAAARGVAGTLRVGFTTTTEQTLIHDLVRFDERYPDCEVIADRSAGDRSV